MNRDYEIFELLPDGSPIWKGHGSGLDSVRVKLEKLAAKTANECIAMHLPTREIVARVNIGAAKVRSAEPLVFQIAYEERLAASRSQTLRHNGYEVVSVIGNEAARLVLELDRSWEFFIVGHDAAKETRKEIVVWLKAHFPNVRLLALSASPGGEIPGADYNAPNAPELWLPILVHEFASRGERPKTAGLA
jgi:hypothetical protein